MLALVLEALDQPALAQCTGLINQDVTHAAELADVILVRVILQLEGGSSVADEHDIDTAAAATGELLKTHVVVNAAIGQRDALAPLLVVAELAAGPGRRVGPQDDRREQRREGARRGDRGCQRHLDAGRLADHVVADLVLAQTEAAPGLQVGGVEGEERRATLGGRQLLERAVAEQVLLVAVDQEIAG